MVQKTSRVIPTTSERLKSLRLFCRCPGGSRRMPIRFAPWILDIIKAHDPNRLFATYRCKDCGGVVRMAAAAALDAETT